MTDMMDALDMTVEDIADEDRCVNCHADIRDDGDSREVSGWGTLCQFCYEDMWDARIEQAR